MMKGQQGFTLVELIIATAIMGVIFSGLGEAIHQVVTIPEYGDDRLMALHELQNVAHWVNLDGQMAQSATDGSELVLTMPDTSSISYTLAGTELIRSAGTANRTLAKNITYVNFTVEGRCITMDIASSPPGRWGVSENETYKVYLRTTGE
jgi:prepilin-type N-terminal cleavage/methylation domain-containing protein